MSESFEFQCTLSGQKYSLRPLHEHDFNSLFSVASDQKLWEGHPSKDRYKKSNFEKWFASTLESGAALVVLENENKTVIGTSRYYVESSSQSDISIGYTFISRKHWGGEANYEIKTLMLSYAFKYFDVVWFHISPSNIRSQKATQKIGVEFVCEKDTDLSGKLEPWFFYKIGREKWTAINES